MTTAAALLVLAIASGCALAFGWWMFSGATAWLERDEDEARRDDRGHDDE